MEIRRAEEKDIPAIVSLLKVSLGESLMPKSELFWRWKHVENPFGESPVLVANDNGLLVGVRAFMRWEWKQGEKIYKAVRAVDTATHPDFQGKGIFKTLTLDLVASCEKDGVDFIFNSPNASSKPGYLKMGWYSVGKMPLNLYLSRIFAVRSSTQFEQQYSLTNTLSLFPDEIHITTNMLSTCQSKQFIRWRYELNPNIKYYSFCDESGNFLYFTIFRLKRNKLGVEFRVCENWISDKANKVVYKEHLAKAIKQSGANMVSSAQPLPVWPSITLSIGPEITARALNNMFSINFKNWSPSLGDMEVF